MSDTIQGSETEEEVITTPEQAIQAGEDGPSEEKVTPAPSSGDAPDENLEEDKPAEGGEGEPAGEVDKTGKVPAEDKTPPEPKAADGIKSQNLSEGDDKTTGIKRIPGESPKEFALRSELKRKSDLLRKARGDQLLGGAQPEKVVAAPQVLSEDEQKFLESVDPEQVKNQEKLFAILAKKQGYVRKDDLSQTTYKETSQTVLDEWMEKHPEYSEDKDPDGILWQRFSEEFSAFKPPANPKDHLKIFNKIHNEIFGITTKDKIEKDLKTVQANQQKVNTASAGAGGSAPRKLSDRRQASPADQELAKAARSGGLSGFSEKELSDMGL